MCLANVSVNGVVRYQPNTRAMFRHPDGRKPWSPPTRRAGTRPSPPTPRRATAPGVLRVAVIGDSYVHGSFVNVEEGFPEVIERQLAPAGVRAEVLRFGMDGAPLSQYLHMLRREVRHYQPDVVLVQLIHNDFDESYRFLKTRYASSFLKIGVEQAGRPVEIEPADFKPRHGATCCAISTRSATSTTRPTPTCRLKNLVSRYVVGRATRSMQAGVHLLGGRYAARSPTMPRTASSPATSRRDEGAGAQDGFKLVFAMEACARRSTRASRPRATRCTSSTASRAS